MAKKILINAFYPEEVRVAVVKEGVLDDFFMEASSRKTIMGNIYKGVVTHIEPGLQAAFVDFGEGRNGFLPMGEIHPKWWSRRPKGERPRIERVLRRGQEVIVQVSREEMGEKGAALTTYLSLPGRYLVLMPDREIKGVSLKIEKENQRKRLREIVSKFDLPKGMGFIVRTAAAGRTRKELLADFNYLLRLWEMIKSRGRQLQAPALLYREGEIAVKVIRDYFSPEVKEVVVDEEGTYRKVLGFFEELMPRYRRRVKLYKEELPLFSRYHIEEQVERIFSREVPLPSGGSIILDVTEALVAIDVNSGRAQQAKNVEEMAFITNLEAAEEIARQLRLRDLGGIIVIDFIDMKDPSHKKEVEKRMRKALKEDRAKLDLFPISKLGLMEISRQRLRASLIEEAHEVCPWCRGMGWVRTPQSVAVAVLRKLRERLSAGGIREVEVKVSPEVAEYLLNNKREDLAMLESRHKVRITVRASTEVPYGDYVLDFSKAPVPWYKRLFGKAS